MAVDPPIGGLSSASNVAVAFPGDAARTYLYRPGQLLVGSESQSLVADQLRVAGAALEYSEPSLDAALYRVPPSLDIPGFIADVTKEEDVDVSPNHVFWIAEEEEEEDEEEAHAGDQEESTTTHDEVGLLGYGLVGDLLDTQPQQTPSRSSTRHTVIWIDTPPRPHPVITNIGITASPGFSDHGTTTLGALLLRANLEGILIPPAVDDDGFVDEFSLGATIAATAQTPDEGGAGRSAAVIFLPLGGFTHDDRPPVSLARLTVRTDLLLVGAAGNHGSERPFWPAAAEGAMAVGAVDSRGRLAPWSGRGTWVNHYELGAGVATVATPDRWVRASGTSIATAVFGARLVETMVESGLDPRAALQTLKVDPSRPAFKPRSSTHSPEPAAPSTEQGGGSVSHDPESPPESGSATTPPFPPPREPASATLSSTEALTATASSAPRRPPFSAHTTSRLAPSYLADSPNRDTLVDAETDALSIRGDVDVLASVIASSRISPPLSLGIFGDWGAGKSFLMTQLQLRVKELTAAAKRAKAADPAAESYYYPEICQIEFNAWQYAGGQQLWASLVSRVFEGVRDHVGNDESYRAIMARIARQDEAVQKATADLKNAADNLARIGKPEADPTMAALKQASNEDIAVTRAVDKLAKAVGRPPDDVDVAEVQEQVEELQNVSGRLRQGLRLLRDDQMPRAALFLICLFVVALLAGITLVPGVGRVITAAAGVLVAALAVVVAALRSANDLLSAGLRVLRTDRRVLREYSKAKSDHDRAQSELARLKQEGPAGLYGFVAERYRADDYRQYLGMVPLIRGDLKELDRHSREGMGSLDRIVLYIDDLDRCPPDQVVKVLEAVNLLFAFPLFVVIIAVDARWLRQSLEHEFAAVFRDAQSAVPTAQDYLEKIIQIPFWLRPMDSEGFSRLVDTMMDVAIGPSQPANGGSTDGLARPNAVAASGPSNGEARPQASEPYASDTTGGDRTNAGDVEARPDGAGKSIDRRLRQSQADVRGSVNEDQGGDEPKRTPEHATTHRAGVSRAPLDATSSEPQEPLVSDVSRTRTMPPDNASSRGLDPRPGVNITPEALIVSALELDYLRDLAPLVTTPRATKRLVNTYQLVRVSVDDVEAFIAKNEYRAVLLLLTLVTTPPGLSLRGAEALLGEDDARRLDEYVSQAQTGGTSTADQWTKRLAGVDVGDITVADVRRWLPIVARFSFNAELAGLGPVVEARDSQLRPERSPASWS
jgi:hypothetical protein